MYGVVQEIDFTRNPGTERKQDLEEGSSSLRFENLVTWKTNEPFRWTSAEFLPILSIARQFPEIAGC
jgi:hypothetical protein